MISRHFAESFTFYLAIILGRLLVGMHQGIECEFI
jgi:hypothetical protein